MGSYFVIHAVHGSINSILVSEQAQQAQYLLCSLMCDSAIRTSLRPITVNIVKSALKHHANFQTRKLFYLWSLVQ